MAGCLDRGRRLRRTSEKGDCAWITAPGGAFTRPASNIERLNATVNKFLFDSEMKKNLESQGMLPSGGTPEKFDRRIRADYERWVKVVKDAGIKIE